MRIILCLLAFVSLSSFSFAQRAKVDHAAAKTAFAYLNNVRKTPTRFARELGFPRNARVTKTPLRWNEVLAKVAEDRAMDMAKRNYFDHTDPDGLGPNYHIHMAGYTLHTDWLTQKDANYFESIGANHATAIDGLNSMIRGSAATRYAHRKHLLGLDEWNASLQDIGIGYVRVPSGSTYQSYLCVIIAKHDW